MTNRLLILVGATIGTAFLLDAAARADGCAYVEDWVACREAEKAEDAERADELERRRREHELEREAEAAREAERQAQERAVDDAATRGRCAMGGC